jgi:hypothetical protein
LGTISLSGSNGSFRCFEDRVSGKPPARFSCSMGSSPVMKYKAYRLEVHTQIRATYCPAWLSAQKNDMMHLSPALVIIVFAFIFTGCSKEDTASESALYGTWVKGSNAGDTLRFMRKDNKYIMLQNTEKEYRFRNGRLSIKIYAPVSQEFYPLDSFSWTQVGEEFTIKGFQLFMFMSSTQTTFTYRKL